MEFVCSKTVDTGETRRMLYGVKHPHLDKHKAELLARRVRPFRRKQLVAVGPRLPDQRASAHLRQWPHAPAEPFFLHDCKSLRRFGPGAVSKNRGIARRDLIECTMMLNKEVDWQELGFVCDGRFLFTQRSLQTCLLPDKFSRFLPSEQGLRMTFTNQLAAAWQKNNSLLCVGLDPDRRNSRRT
jgi:adenine-specific DNA-methyltransferase